MISAHILARRLGRVRLGVASLYTQADLGKMYMVEREQAESLALDRVLPLAYRRQLETLGECSWLCRAPLVEAVSCLQSVRESLPALRLLLWGKFGCGKTITCIQLVHWARLQGFVIVHVPRGECEGQSLQVMSVAVMSWTRKVRDVQPSTHKTGRIDTPNHAVEVLQLFKQQNQPLWSKLGVSESSALLRISTIIAGARHIPRLCVEQG